MSLSPLFVMKMQSLAGAPSHRFVLLACRRFLLLVELPPVDKADDQVQHHKDSDHDLRREETDEGQHKHGCYDGWYRDEKCYSRIHFDLALLLAT